MPDTDVRHITGRRGEELAAKYLEGKGYHVRECGRRARRGEIDIIAEMGETIVFVEVKSRTAGTPGGEPWEKISPSKLRRISRVGEAWAREQNLDERPLRIDVIAVVFDGGEARITHYENVTLHATAPG